MKKSTKIIIILLALVTVGLIAVATINSIKKSNELAAYSEWDYISGNDLNGHIDDHVIGNKDAKVKIIEYADYQCSACAASYPYVVDIAEEYGDNVALIFRTYVLSYHPNGNAVATAATAAGLQGYFEEYSALVFSKQNDWYDLEGAERDAALSGYLETVSNGSADMDKYRSDLKSSAIKDKIAFDRSLASRIDLSATPTIYVNQQKYTIPSVKEAEFKSGLRNLIENALREAGVEVESNSEPEAE